MKLKRFFLLLSACSAFAQAQTFFWHRDTVLAGAGGIGKAYNWSRTPDGIGGRPISNTDDSFDTGIDTSKAWKFLDQDGVDSSGKVVAANGKIILSGQGQDFTAGMHFLTGVKRSDNKGIFDVTVRIDSQYAAHDWSKAGIIMANDFSNYGSGGVALVAITPRNGAIFEYNLNQPMGNIDNTDKMEGVSLPLPIWLRLVKGSGTVSAFYRLDSNSAWIRIGIPRATLGLTTDSELGLFVVSVDSAGKPPKKTAAVFDDFRGGGEIVNPALDLSFNGNGLNSDVDVVLAEDFSAHSLDFTGYAGKLSFNSYALSLSGNLKLAPGMQKINPGTGTIAFTGTTQDTLWPRPSDTLPILRKAGIGKLVLMDSTEAVSLKMEAGTLDLNNQSLSITTLTATGGSLEGLGADDSLTVAGNADFGGLASLALPNGHVLVKAAGNGGAPVTFNPGGKTFPKLILHTGATGTGKATLTVGPGALTVLNGLLLRNQGAAAGFDGVVDFRSHDPAVTVAGDLTQIQSGSGSNLQTLYMGDGYWTCAGNVSLNLQGGGSSDNSTLRLSAVSGTQVLMVAQGPLYKVEHDNAATLKLGGPLSATHLSQTVGALDFNGFNLALQGNLTVSKGGPQSLLNLGGRKLTIDGNAAFAGTSAGNLGLNPSAPWFLEVGGTLTADSADIANSDASPGKPGAAAKGCNDQKGNKNWSFWQPPLPPTVTREPADVLAKPGWKVSFSLEAQGTAPFTYEWRKLGDSAVLSRDTALVLDSVKESQNGSAWFAVVSNAQGKDTTRLAFLTVRACDSLFTPPLGITVNEGAKVVLGARTGCAAEVVWNPVSGPVPKLFDPQVDTLIFTAPRVQGDSTLVLQFSARYGTNWESGLVTVKVKDTIPDPVVELPPQPVWTGAAPKVIRAALKNSAALAAFPGYPVRYLWNVVPFVADTSSAGDSLVLAEPGENGNLDITVCADNGGAPFCAAMVLAVERPVVGLRKGPGVSGSLVREGSGFRWTRSGLARIVDWRGRMLWQAWGSAGGFAEPGAGAASALRSRAARLEFLAPRP